MKVNEETKWVEVDLHGYTVLDAVELAANKVKEAWVNGFSQITLIHGAPGSRHHFSAARSGYGGIKWQLRGMLSRGDLSKWVYNRRSTKHSLEGGCMTLRLRPNPNPAAPSHWTEMPEPYYRR